MPSTLSLARPQAPSHAPADRERRSAAARRVQLALVAVALMGLADLACTVIYMTHIGLLEANPIARLMIEIGGLRQLVLFKLLTMTVSCGCLYLARFHRRTELFAWTCAAILLLITVQWVRYNSHIPSMTHELGIIALSDPAMSAEVGWVTLVD